MYYLQSLVLGQLCNTSVNTLFKGKEVSSDEEICSGLCIHRVNNKVRIQTPSFIQKELVTSIWGHLLDKIKFVHLGSLQPLAFFIAERVLGCMWTLNFYSEGGALFQNGMLQLVGVQQLGI